MCCIAKRKLTVQEYWKRQNLELGTKMFWNDELPDDQLVFLLDKWGIGEFKIVWFHDYEFFNVMTPKGVITVDLNMVKKLDRQ